MPNPVGFALTPIGGNDILSGFNRAKAFIREVAENRPCCVFYVVEVYHCRRCLEWNGERFYHHHPADL